MGVLYEYLTESEGLLADIPDEKKSKIEDQILCIAVQRKLFQEFEFELIWSPIW